MTAVLHLLMNNANTVSHAHSVHMLQTLAASHHTSDATVTVLLKERRVSPSSETKLGKAPKNVDYIGTSALVPAVCWVLTCIQRTDCVSKIVMTLSTSPLIFLPCFCIYKFPAPEVYLASSNLLHMHLTLAGALCNMGFYCHYHQLTGKVLTQTHRHIIISNTIVYNAQPA